MNIWEKGKFGARNSISAVSAFGQQNMWTKQIG